MDIKWYKNHWYWISIVISIAIIALGVLSSLAYNVAIFTDEETVYLFSAESLYRSFFNPLWAVVIWTWNQGQKLNARRHSDILLTVQGALDSHDEDEIKISKIYDIVFDYENIEVRMKKKYKRTDTVEGENTDPEL